MIWGKSRALWLAAVGVAGLPICGNGLGRVGFGGTGILACAEFGTQPGMAVLQEQAAPQRTPPHNTMRPAPKWKQLNYSCEDNAKIVVYIHESYAKVRYEDHVYLMRQTPAADGTRYSDGKVAWSSKGEDGFLQEDNPDGDGRKLVKDCLLDKAAADEAASSTVSGTLMYLVRMGLPAQAVIEVQLQDVSQADTPATIAEEKFALGPRSAPVPFSLKYDSGKIDPKHTYALSARISMAGELKFASKEPYKVVTQGNPSKVEMILLPAGGKP